MKPEQDQIARAGPNRLMAGRWGIVCIGSSTGGPNILDKIITGLPADLGAPIVVAQHMPPRFTESFAANLDRNSALTVVHAEDGMPIYPGVVYIGRGKQHVRVIRPKTGKPYLEINDLPPGLYYKPSADELLRSGAMAYGKATLGIVLSGIGRDGTEGARAIKLAGGMVVTQAAETCVVYGMPKSCVEAGLSDLAAGPEEIRQILLRLSPGVTAPA
ncbi:MAG: chemotaxis protein CheB [Phycisphaeraceae bacterium]|nr:chemotaxis protein CheB [Phycisphaeraceae bacterium]